MTDEERAEVIERGRRLEELCQDPDLSAAWELVDRDIERRMRQASTQEEAWRCVCELQASERVKGKLYAVIRHGRDALEELKEEQQQLDDTEAATRELQEYRLKAEAARRDVWQHTWDAPQWGEG